MIVMMVMSGYGVVTGGLWVVIGGYGWLSVVGLTGDQSSFFGVDYG